MHGQNHVHGQRDGQGETKSPQITSFAGVYYIWNSLTAEVSLEIPTTKISGPLVAKDLQCFRDWCDFNSIQSLYSKMGDTDNPNLMW